MMRLDKLLAHLNYGSRKEVKSYIRKGLIAVNGEIVYDDDFKVDEELDEIFFLGEQLHYEKNIYLMLNKPAGVVSATFDIREETVLDLIEGYDNRGLFPVGRLDKDTTGLLILTNDGKLAHDLLSPVKHVSKTYIADFIGTFKDSYIEKFKAGITLEDGYLCKPAKLTKLKDHTAMISITEGKYHQVKRMFESVGLEVVGLKRVSFGNLELPSDLEEGSYRVLTDEEIDILKKSNP